MSRQRSRSPLHSRTSTLLGRRDGYYGEQYHAAVRSDLWRGSENVDNRNVEGDVGWDNGPSQTEELVDHWAKFIEAIGHAEKQKASSMSRYHGQDSIQSFEEDLARSPRNLPRERLSSPEALHFNVETHQRIRSPGQRRNEHNIDPRYSRSSSPRHSQGKRHERQEHGFHNEEHEDRYKRSSYGERSLKPDYREHHLDFKGYRDLDTQEKYPVSRRAFSQLCAPVIVEHDHGILKHDARIRNPSRDRERPRSRDPARERECQRTRDPVRDRDQPKNGGSISNREHPRNRDPVSQRDPPRSRDPISQRDPPRSRDPVSQRDPPRSRDPVSQRDPSRSHDPISQRDPPRNRDPVSQRDPPRSRDPISQRDPPRSIDPVSQRDPPRSHDPARNREYPKGGGPVRHQEHPRSHDLVRDREHSRTSDPLKTSDLPRGRGFLKNRETQRGIDPTRERESSRGKEQHKHGRDYNHNPGTSLNDPSCSSICYVREDSRFHTSSNERGSPLRGMRQHKKPLEMGPHSRVPHGPRAVDEGNFEESNRARASLLDWKDEQQPRDNHGGVVGHGNVLKINPRHRNPNHPGTRMDFTSHETLKIKVDMSRPVHQTSLLGYSSERQLSLDLVSVGRQRLDFLPMLEHSGTFKETAMHSGTFAQEVITLVHQVKENFFRGQGITLNERFSNEQEYSLGDEFADDDREMEDVGPVFHRPLGSTSLDTQIFCNIGSTQSQKKPHVPAPGDLRHDLERKRQERLEGVKITIAGGNFAQILPPSQESESEYVDGEDPCDAGWSLDVPQETVQWDDLEKRSVQDFNVQRNLTRVRNRPGQRLKRNSYNSARW